jgi:hypothetical protein
MDDALSYDPYAEVYGNSHSSDVNGAAALPFPDLSPHEAKGDYQSIFPTANISQ